MLQKFKKLAERGASCLSGATRVKSKFSKNEDGLAAIEFALLSPLLLTFTLGSFEIIQSVWADGKVELAAGTVGDLVSRASTMTDSDLRMLGQAGPLVLQPYPQNDLRFTITSAMGCYDDPMDTTSDFKFYVLWSQIWEAGSLMPSPHTLDSEFNELPANLIIPDGETLIHTTALYHYAPTIARTVGTTYEMGGTIFHQPRGTSSDRVSYPTAEASTARTCADFRP